MVPQLKTCCCGCSVRTGTLIIGWLSMVGTVLGIILGIAGAVLLDKAIDELGEDEDSVGPYGNAKDLKKVYSIIIIVLIVAVVLCAFEGLVTGLLLHGVYKARPNLFKPWLIFAIIGLVLHSISMVGNIIMHFASGNTGTAVLQMFFAPCGILIGLYYLCVVNSHRMELLSRNASPKI